MKKKPTLSILRFSLLIACFFFLTYLNSRPVSAASATYEQSVTGVSSAATTVTSASLVGGTNQLYLAAIVAGGSNTTVTSVSGLDLTWTQLAAPCSARGGVAVHLWKAHGNSSGGTVTATISSSSVNAALTVSRFSNVHSTAPIGNLVTANTFGIDGACAGGTDTNSYSISYSTTSGNLLYGTIGIRARENTPGTAWQELAEVHHGSGGDTVGVAAVTSQAASTSTTLSGTLSSTSNWGLVGLEIIGSSGTQPSGNCAGDINGDLIVDLSDFSILASHFLSTNPQSDLNGDGFVDLSDFSILSMNFLKTCAAPTSTPTPSLPPITPSPTPAITPSPTPAPKITPTPTPSPTPTSRPISSSGVWISATEAQQLPIAGQSGCASGSLCANAWNSLLNVAKSSWSTPNLSDYAGLTHSGQIYAGALAAVRLSVEPGRETEAQALRDKTLQGLEAVVGTETAALPSSGGGYDDGSLAIVRQFPRYVLAADLLGIDWKPGYKGYSNFVDYMLHTKFTFRVGDGGFTFAESHDSFASNSNSMAGGARVISAAYLNDTAELDRAWLTFRRYTGDSSVGPNLGINDSGQTWFYANYDTTPHVGINPKGTTCNGKTYPADGVIPADQGRGSTCPSNSSTAPGYTQYPWEGIQGAFAQAEVFYRRGYRDPKGNDAYRTSESALLRAATYQWYLRSTFGNADWYDGDRAAWVKHLLYYRYGYKPITYDAYDGGRNLSLTQWTHQ